MKRRLASDELALWQRVAATVRPLAGRARPHPPEHVHPQEGPSKARPAPRPAPPRSQASAPANTLDSSWDRRLDRGLAHPDVTIDLHGHSLASAHALLDRRLGDAVAAGVRLVLLITGKPPQGDRVPVGRGAIRGVVGDWLAASRHAGEIAAVRPAHRRHGGAGALYLILRRSRRPNRQNS